MDFFEQQRKTRRQSRWVLVNFVAAMLAIAGLIHIVATVAGMRPGEPLNFYSVSDHAKLIIGLIWLTIGLGGFFRWLDVRGGGARLAKRFGAEPVERSSRYTDDKQLCHIVSEMAVAANVPEPSVWVLRRESSINAFVVGSGSVEKGDLDVAIVISQGALDLLDREELQGVVAHEFGHIVHGDLPVNMRLLIVLGGLMAIDEVGQTLIPSDTDQVVHPGVIVGFILRALGSVGVLAGTLIRAAFSRKREFLADASAVQFTRDKNGLASALDKVRELIDDASLNSPYAAELAHLCFHMTWSSNLIKRALATHPTPTDRIASIDPYFQIKRRKKQQAEEVAKHKSEVMSSINTQDINSLDQSPVINNAGDSGLSDRFELIVSDTMGPVAALFALFISRDADRSAEYFNALAFAYNQSFADKVKSVGENLGEELKQHPLKAVEQIAPRLQEIKPDNRRLLLVNLEKLVELEGESNLKNYALLQVLRSKLQTDFPIIDNVVGDTGVKANRSKVKRMDELSEELALLLSLIVESSGADLVQLEDDYRRVLKCYTNQHLPRRSANDEGVVDDLKRAFQALYVQPLSQREAFVQHCVEIIHYDDRMVKDEKMLLDLFAASLEVDNIVAA